MHFTKSEGAPANFNFLLSYKVIELKKKLRIYLYLFSRAGIKICVNNTKQTIIWTVEIGHPLFHYIEPTS